MIKEKNPFFRYRFQGSQAEREGEKGTNAGKTRFHRPDSFRRGHGKKGCSGTGCDVKQVRAALLSDEDGAWNGVGPKRGTKYE